MTAPEGMALTSGEDMQLAGEKLGLFAHTGQLSLKSGEGAIDVQAQNASLRLFAEKKLRLSSASDISFAGKKRITLIGDGSYPRLEAGKIEYGTTTMYLRRTKRTMAATRSALPLDTPRALLRQLCGNLTPPPLGNAGVCIILPEGERLHGCRYCRRAR